MKSWSADNDLGDGDGDEGQEEYRTAVWQVTCPIREPQTTPGHVAYTLKAVAGKSRSAHSDLGDGDGGDGDDDNGGGDGRRERRNTKLQSRKVPCLAKHCTCRVQDQSQSSENQELTQRGKTSEGEPTAVLQSPLPRH